MSAEEQDRELAAACAAVRLAARLCAEVQTTLTSSESTEKADESPVTVADYGAQALVAWSLQHCFPGIPLSMVAEEDAAELRTRDGTAMLARVTALVNATLDGGAAALTQAEVADLIDAGSSVGGRTGAHWVLDPIDGTKGFLAGRQYAVCLARLRDGVVTLGALGCPNLPLQGPVTQPVLDAIAPGPPGADAGLGCLFTAAAGRGAHVEPLWQEGGARDRIRAAADVAPTDAVYMTSAEALHSRHGFTDSLAAQAGVDKPPLKLDSQVKYGLLARGDASVFLRMPPASYKEKIWDHAAGCVIVAEAGGFVSDGAGKALNFGEGRFLESLDRGVIAAASKQLHVALVQARTASC